MAEEHTTRTRHEIAKVAYDIIMSNIVPGSIDNYGFAVKGDRHELSFTIADRLLEKFVLIPK